MNTVPHIGQVWPGQGGVYLGVARGRDGQLDHHIILASAKPAKRLTWKQAIAWALKVEADGHTDFSLPDRYESAVMFGNGDELFERNWHWTATQYSDAGAWIQYFDDGGQGYLGKSNEFFARAVRRLPVNPSVLSNQGDEVSA